MLVPSGWVLTWRLHTKVYKFGHKISPNISHMKNCIDLNLGKDLCIFTSFHIPVSGFIPLNGFDFYV